MSKHVDIHVVVIGAGPAGAIVAKQLTQWGYRVAVIQRPRRFTALEGLSERALAGLRYADCKHTLAQVNIQAERAAYWNGTYSQANYEWLIERQPFDQVLLADITQAGVTVYSQRARQIHFDDNQQCWFINLNDSQLRADYLIEARGRAAPQTDQKLRRGPLTVALSQRWQLAKAYSPRTQVMAFAEGWAWFATQGNGEALVQLSLSSEQQNLPIQKNLADFYHSKLSQIEELDALLDDAKAVRSVYARYAQPQINFALIDNHQARVGDAAFAIDPLSGHGIFAALGGAFRFSGRCKYPIK